MVGKILKPVKLFKTIWEKSKLPVKFLTDGQKDRKTRKTFSNPKNWIPEPENFYADY
jgi:hypothetical protein